MYVQRRIRESDYELLARFYGRDLGGQSYFNWKNFLDPLDSRHAESQAICYEESSACLGIAYSRHYLFRLNSREFRVNLIGDLGVDRRCRSGPVAVALIRHAIDPESDLIVCFSDDRKTLVYQKILTRYFTPTTQVIRYTEVRCRPVGHEPYREIEADAIPDTAWRNHFGRKRNRQASDYLKCHPLYRTIHYLQHEDKYLTLGVSEDCADVVDLSDTSESHILWGLGVAAQFNETCRILLHESRLPAVSRTIPVLHEKPLCMLIGYLKDVPIFDEQRVWIGRLDRR
ncbi:hypothetical protein NDK50_29975 [Paraburkholderia bryophila]|uniref:hypothetical protein n=1 Tax=Paraburkholderia bryophila TaxID=420952 RepID=UPI002348FA4A|nr:hypothetical protein [Paraburkholderia bryophila]WCM22247.1 hypothetical protein NDK50_29975 [Paraburkholderia bryophila]